MSNLFPVKLRKDDLNGPLETITFVAGLIVGGYLGWAVIGPEVNEYLGQLSSQNPSGLLTFAQTSPTLIKLLGVGVCADYTQKGLRLAGSLVDKVIGTYHESD